MINTSILLIEDDLDDQAFFLEALEGVENTTLFGLANNGKEGLEWLSNGRGLPDMIFMDINMPLMNGIDCLTMIVENPLTNKIPVIMLSTHDGQQELVKKIGARCFFTKPVNPDILRMQIQQAISLDTVYCS